MAEERTLGLVRVQDQSTDDLSKEELQRRLDETRDSISHTVTEIKETVQHQVQAVKDTLDWKEQVKKRPVAWSAGAAGVGFLVGYCIAATAKGDSESHSTIEGFTANAISSTKSRPQYVANGKEENAGPGLWQRMSETPAYGRVRDEAGSLGDAFVNELSKTAKQVLLPAVITSIRSFLGDHLPKPANSNSAEFDSSRNEQNRPGGLNYQPKLERNQ
jgi:hypothetical protein